MKKANILLWYYLLTKRLFKKPAYLLLLAMIPLLALGMRLAANEESGVLNILLYQENPNDDLSNQIINDLTSRKTIVQFTAAASEQDACHAVESGDADAAWLFPDRMQEQIDAYMTRSESSKAVVTILEREDNIALQLSREILYGVLYPACSYSLYQHFLLEQLPNENMVTPTELEQAYTSAGLEGNLFRRSFVNNVESDSSRTGASAPHYLLTPLRGLLSLLIVLCGLASCLYYMQDEAAGTFTWIPAGSRIFFSCRYHFPAIACAGLFVLSALYLSGSFTQWHRELLLMGLYILATAGFCDLIRSLTGKVHRMAVIIPVLMLVMLAVCPVFLSGGLFRPLQWLLPPFYYLNAVHNQIFLYYLLCYLPAVYAIRFLSGWFQNKR